jgi:hypothetical protein
MLQFVGISSLIQIALMQVTRNKKNMFSWMQKSSSCRTKEIMAEHFENSFTHRYSARKCDYGLYSLPLWYLLVFFLPEETPSCLNEVAQRTTEISDYLFDVRKCSRHGSESSRAVRKCDRYVRKCSTSMKSQTTVSSEVTESARDSVVFVCLHWWHMFLNKTFESSQHNMGHIAKEFTFLNKSFSVYFELRISTANIGFISMDINC